MAPSRRVIPHIGVGRRDRHHRLAAFSQALWESHPGSDQSRPVYFLVGSLSGSLEGSDRSCQGFYP